VIPGGLDSRNDGLPDELASELDAFVFFHLGSDAEVAVRGQSDGFRLSIRHRRVSPIEVDLDSRKIADFCRRTELFEEFLLDLLTRRRRDT
jgi:hypothetical protein